MSSHAPNPFSSANEPTLPTIEDTDSDATGWYPDQEFVEPEEDRTLNDPEDETKQNHKYFLTHIIRTSKAIVSDTSKQYLLELTQAMILLILRYMLHNTFNIPLNTLLTLFH